MGVGCSMWRLFLLFWPKSQPQTHPPVVSLGLKDVDFSLLPSLPTILILEAILDPLSDSEGFFRCNGFSLVPPALPCLLLSLHRLRLSLHTGNRSSESRLSFLAFLKQMLFPVLALKYERRSDDSPNLFRECLMGFVKKKETKNNKKEPSRGPGLHVSSQFPGTSPSCHCSWASLPQVTSDLHGLCVYSCILRRYVSAAISSVAKVTCLPVLDLLIALQPQYTQGFRKSHELAVCWTISVSVKAVLFPALCISKGNPKSKTLPAPPDLFLWCFATWELVRSKDRKGVKLNLKFCDVVIKPPKLKTEVQVSSTPLSLLEPWAS